LIDTARRQYYLRTLTGKLQADGAANASATTGY
jgi:hypothetical protein